MRLPRRWRAATAPGTPGRRRAPRRWARLSTGCGRRCRAPPTSPGRRRRRRSGRGRAGSGAPRARCPGRRRRRRPRRAGAAAARTRAPRVRTPPRPRPRERARWRCRLRRIIRQVPAPTTPSAVQTVAALEAAHGAERAAPEDAVGGEVQRALEAWRRRARDRRGAGWGGPGARATEQQRRWRAAITRRQAADVGGSVGHRWIRCAYGVS